MEDCKSCREMTIEEELNSLPIDAGLKEELIKRVRYLEDDKVRLITHLEECSIQLDRMRAAIVKLAMMLAEK